MGGVSDLFDQLASSARSELEDELEQRATA
jgi:hypothetical protein